MPIMLACIGMAFLNCKNTEKQRVNRHTKHPLGMHGYLTSEDIYSMIVPVLPRSASSAVSMDVMIARLPSLASIKERDAWSLGSIL